MAAHSSMFLASHTVHVTTRGEHQADHDGLHEDVGRHEHRPGRQIARQLALPMTAARLARRRGAGARCRAATARRRRGCRSLPVRPQPAAMGRQAGGSCRRRRWRALAERDRGHRHQREQTSRASRPVLRGGALAKRNLQARVLTFGIAMLMICEGALVVPRPCRTAQLGARRDAGSRRPPSNG